MFDKTTTNERLNDLYKVLIAEGFTINLAQYGGFYAQRDGGYRVPCSMKLLEYLNGDVTTEGVQAFIFGWDAYIDRIAREVENDAAHHEEDLLPPWDEIRRAVEESGRSDLALEVASSCSNL